ncbi:hypothetical protein H4217_000688 [Coemansia sp. RSA 1939]|nr:hypothetical protein H4217_000688 [Coemansia sp. RSA 1939]KAJ2608980.1 hypothetical protein EV177_004694 [Coemansia sp. RSA 1804]KAJ2688130.1 hypothetical protein GGH99_003099 [Coemansia sp. RSA 1285]
MLVATDVLEHFKVSNVLYGLGAYAAWEVFYALYLSPLRNVPGSFWTRISKLPMMIADIRGTGHEFMLWHHQKYGSIFVMEPKKIAVCDPDDCVTVLGTHAFLKDEKYGNVDFIEPNLFLTRDPTLNKQRRRQIGPALSTSNLLKMEDVVLAAGPKQLLAKWDTQLAKSDSGKAVICYHYDFVLLTFDIIGTLGFGQTHRSLTSGDRQITHWVKQSFNLLFVQFIFPKLAKSWLFKNVIAKTLHRDVDDFIKFSSQAIEQRKALLAEKTAVNSEKPNDILQSFIDAQDNESQLHMTSSQVVTETIISMLAGSDTSSNTLSFTIHLLLMHPQHLRKATNEARSVFERSHVITYTEALKSLPFLEACMYESMRLLPVSTNLPRCMPRGGTVIQGHFIPDDHTCSVSTLCSNVNEGLWGSQPLAYNPQRFIQDPALKKRIMTFSMGVRACPGRNLAVIEILTTLANIVNAYDLEIPEDSLFTPDRVDKKTGIPFFMPGMSGITYVPRFPDRDCNVAVSRRVD